MTRSVTILNIIAILIASAAIFFAAAVSAQSPFDELAYPIDALGGCESREACRTFCDDLENADACLAFAEEHSLLPKEKIERAREVVATKEGPGGCTSKSECRAYCSDAANLEECVDFGEKHGTLPEQASERAKLVLAALKDGEHLPGGCKTREECAAFCSDRTAIRQCVEFSTKIGLLKGEVAALASSTAALIEKGETPGSCANKEECVTYCRDATHRGECATFAERAGLMTSVQSAEVRSGIFEGPGGCTSRQECAAFCNVADNHETCLEFASRQGLMKSEEVATLRSTTAKVRQDLQNAASEVATCVRGSVDAALLERIESGNALPPNDVAVRIRACFDRVGGGGTSGAMQHMDEDGTIMHDGSMTDRPKALPTASDVRAECEAKVKRAVEAGELAREDAENALLRCRNAMLDKPLDVGTTAGDGVIEECLARVRNALANGTVTREQADDAMARCKNTMMKGEPVTTVAPDAKPQPLPSTNPVEECLAKVRRAVETGTIRKEDAESALARCRAAASGTGGATVDAAGAPVNYISGDARPPKTTSDTPASSPPSDGGGALASSPNTANSGITIEVKGVRVAKEAVMPTGAEGKLVVVSLLLSNRNEIAAPYNAYRFRLKNSAAVEYYCDQTAVAACKDPLGIYSVASGDVRSVEVAYWVPVTDRDFTLLYENVVLRIALPAGETAERALPPMGANGFRELGAAILSLYNLLTP